MAAYVVMDAPDGRDGEQALFIRSGFSALAFLVPVVWFAWHRLWLEAALVLAVTLGLALAVEQGWLLEAGAPLLTLLVSLYAGLEASSLRIAGLARRGWQERGTVRAGNAADAELRWFGGRGAPGSAGSGPGSPAVPALKPALAGSPAEPFMGLIDVSGVR